MKIFCVVHLDGVCENKAHSGGQHPAFSIHILRVKLRA